MHMVRHDHKCTKLVLNPIEVPQLCFENVSGKRLLQDAATRATV